MPKLAGINVFPFKALDAHSVAEARVLPSGALEGDRRFALVDERGDFINGKRTATIHRLRSRFDPAAMQLRLRVEGAADERSYHVFDEREALCDWLGNFFGIPVAIIENDAAGFPDDTLAPGPTITCTATLAAVAGWFPPLSVDETRARFRANLELDAEEAFWEDQLLAAGDRVVRFRIGDVELLGNNPCARCIVPTRHPRTGEPIHGFAKTFALKRRETLPPWTPADRFDHYYRLTINTRPTGTSGGVLRVGDEVRILGVE
jgi:uncharacterized protein YcbX